MRVLSPAKTEVESPAETQAAQLALELQDARERQAILFVDDRASNVDGARMCGWRAMLYRGPESLSQALAQWG